MATSTAPCIGYFGKLPSVGDFVTRRLPRVFIVPWDAWLQRGLSASREQLGEQWLDRYLDSPLWRFALAPGVCGESGWVGVLMPSVDAVGRPFPLTVAQAVAWSDGWRDAWMGACAGECPEVSSDSKWVIHCNGRVEQQAQGAAWYDQVEAVMLDALAPDCTPERLDGWLQQLAAAMPTVVVVRAEEIESGTPADQGTVPRSYWATVESTDSGAIRFACDGLPPAGAFSSLLGAGALDDDRPSAIRSQALRSA